MCPIFVSTCIRLYLSVLVFITKNIHCRVVVATVAMYKVVYSRSAVVTPPNFKKNTHTHRERGA